MMRQRNMALDKSPEYLEGFKQNDINWNYLKTLVANVENPNVKLGSYPLLYHFAIFPNDCEDFSDFLDVFFKHPAIKTALFEKDLIGNTPFIWAVSRVRCVYNSNLSFIGNNVSTEFYNTYHQFSLYANKFYELLSQDTELSTLLYESNWNNTPLLLALKNGNIDLAIKLIPHYPLAALQQQTNAGNTALHVASFFRMDSVINAILKRAEKLNAKDEVLSAMTRTGYTPYDCYSLDLIDSQINEELRQYTGSIKYSTQRITLATQIESFLEAYTPEDTQFFITADIVLNFNYDQESAHPYSQLRRNEINLTLSDALKTNIPQKKLNPNLQTILSQKSGISDEKLLSTTHTANARAFSFSSEDYSSTDEQEKPEVITILEAPKSQNVEVMATDVTPSEDKALASSTNQSCLSSSSEHDQRLENTRKIINKASPRIETAKVGTEHKADPLDESSSSSVDLVKFKFDLNSPILSQFFNSIKLKSTVIIDQLNTHHSTPVATKLYSEVNWPAYSKSKFSVKDLSGISKLKLDIDNINLELEDDKNRQNSLFNLIAYAGKLALIKNSDSATEQKVKSLKKLINKLLSSDNVDDAKDILENALKDDNLTQNRTTGFYRLYSIFKSDYKWNHSARHIVRSTTEELLLDLKITLDDKTVAAQGENTI